MEGVSGACCVFDQETVRTSGRMANLAVSVLFVSVQSKDTLMLFCQVFGIGGAWVTCAFAHQS